MCACFKHSIFNPSREAPTRHQIYLKLHFPRLQESQSPDLWQSIPPSGEGEGTVGPEISSTRIPGGQSYHSISPCSNGSLAGKCPCAHERLGPCPSKTPQQGALCLQTLVPPRLHDTSSKTPLLPAEDGSPNPRVLEQQQQKLMVSRSYSVPFLQAPH